MILITLWIALSLLVLAELVACGILALNVIDMIQNPYGLIIISIEPQGDLRDEREKKND